MIMLMTAWMNKLAAFENPAGFSGCSACWQCERNSPGVTGSD